MSNSNDQLDDSILNIMVEQGVIHPDMLVRFVLEEVVSTALVVRAAIAALVGTGELVSSDGDILHPDAHDLFCEDEEDED